MKRNLLYSLMFTMGLALVSCGTTPDSTTTSATGVGGTGVSGSNPPTSLTVVKSIATAIASSGTVVVTATVFDTYGAVVADGTVVDFTTDLASTSVTQSSQTVSGVAKATFSANNVAGTAIVTATAGSITGFVTIEILPSAPGAITVVSVSPTSMGVKGSGLPLGSTLVFQVVDSYGNPVTDGTTVNFSIGSIIGGGELISPLTMDTVSGQVSVNITSGTKAGLLGVNALVQSTAIATTGTVIIEGGIAIASNFTIGSALSSFEGYDIIGKTNDFSVFVGDYFGNPIRTGTPVSFTTEIGTITSSVTDAVGIASTTYSAAGGDPFGSLKGPSGTGNVGYLTVLAQIRGQEPFIDNNGNGLYDAGDTFTPAVHDYGEPFLDADEDGVFDVGEYYNDLDGNGAYSTGNGVHDVDTAIWNSMVVCLSTANFTVTANPTVVGARTNFAVTIVDANSNPVDGTGTYAAAVTKLTGDGIIGGTDKADLPFGASYSLANGAGTANVPIWVPTYNNTTNTSKDSLDSLALTVTTPSSTYKISGL